MKPLTLFLGGVAVGALAGILLAPDKGTVSRDKIRECLRRRGLLPTNEIDILVEEISTDPEAKFEPAHRPAEDEKE